MAKLNNIFDPLGKGPNNIFATYEQEEEIEIRHADRVKIQYQTFLGVWFTMNTVPKNDQYILRAMQDLQRQKNGARVRAVDDNEMILNII
jgi:hypothetical protein